MGPTTAPIERLTNSKKAFGGSMKQACPKGFLAGPDWTILPLEDLPKGTPFARRAYVLDSRLRCPMAFPNASSKIGIRFIVASMPDGFSERRLQGRESILMGILLQGPLMRTAGPMGPRASV